MRNIIIMFIFIVVFNSLTTVGVNVVSSQESSMIDTSTELYFDDMESQGLNLKDNLITTSTQSEYSTDMMPPLDTNEAGANIFTTFKNGITINVPSEYEDTAFEGFIIKIIRYFSYLINLIFVAWVVIIIYTKVIHP